MEKHRVQRDWDIHFMKEARLWANMSKCLSRKIGSVLVRDKRVIATGYNGPPSGVPHCDFRDDTGGYTDHFISDKCPRHRMGFGSGKGMEHCVAVHSEINPIIQAARQGLVTTGATLYAYCGIPCTNCMKEIIQAGILRIVCLDKNRGDTSKSDYNFPLSEQLCKVAGIQLDMIPEGEIDA